METRKAPMSLEQSGLAEIVMKEALRRDLPTHVDLEWTRASPRGRNEARQEGSWEELLKATNRSWSLSNLRREGCHPSQSKDRSAWRKEDSTMRMPGSNQINGEGCKESSTDEENLCPKAWIWFSQEGDSGNPSGREPITHSPSPRRGLDTPAAQGPNNISDSNPESRVVQYVGSRCTAILRGSISRIYIQFIYPNVGVRGAEPPGIILILRIKNKWFYLKDSQ